jgi:catechol 2,3-dioxygenase-like lactoylglutathione lyase family enzyme
MTSRFRSAVSALAGMAALSVSTAGADARRPMITGVDHVAFLTGDASQARLFYRDVLGLESPQDRPGPAMWFRVNARQRIVLLPGAPVTRAEGRLDHVALATADLAALAAYLRERGMSVEGPRAWPCGQEGVRVADPDGHTIEFVRETAVVAGGPSPRALSGRLLHAGITVRDEAAATRFYGDVLGMSAIWRGGADPAKTSWVNMRVPEGTDYLEFMLIDGVPDPVSLGILHHACLAVPDIQAAWEAARERTPSDYRFQPHPPQIGRNNRWQLNLFDPDGTRVELMELTTVRSR